jgi:hypothetical protein
MAEAIDRWGPNGSEGATSVSRRDDAAWADERQYYVHREKIAHRRMRGDFGPEFHLLSHLLLLAPGARACTIE